MNELDIHFEDVACDCCQSTESRTFLETKDFLFNVPGNFRLVQCGGCGLVYVNPRPDAASLVQLYQTYYTTPPGLRGGAKAARLRKNNLLRAVYHRITGEYISTILARAKGRALDVGCGSGFLLDDLRSRGCEAFGVELNAGEAEAARAKGFSVFCGPLEQAGFPDARFDTVILNHVLEHVPSPTSTLREIFRILKPGGIALLHSPNLNSYQRRMFGSCWAGWHLPFHLYHFTPETMQNMARAAGFSLARCKTVSPEYHFLTSGAASARNTGGILRPLFYRGFIRSLPARLAISGALRFFDFISPGKGDGVRIELSKGN